jgi:hypothetical protein
VTAVVSRDPRRAERFVTRGAEAAVLDLTDVAALGAVLASC